MHAGNLRELALARMARLGLRCRDVRTREVGIQDIHNRVLPRDVELVRRDYAANGGWETFLAYEDPRQDILIGLLRLRRLAGPPKERQPTLHGAPPRRAARCADMCAVPCAPGVCQPALCQCWCAPVPGHRALARRCLFTACIVH